MTIKVSFIEDEKQFPIVVKLAGNDKQRFTKKAAIELKNKLQIAIDDLLLSEAIGVDK